MDKYKEWLERYASGRGISEAEAETHLQAKATKEYYENRESKEISITREYNAINEQIKLNSGTL